ncbi:cupin domain-containing protein [Hyphobacterium sp. HN65]|uniref:Cupin domain-containing protein n=1 Tax=Hyphobacterium lacteum TaxID=3116575 RepID=A0ABU7LM38_9PROT|nr:cupin domain-containing protein [Hyphobacterium sp. HN65]MEE2524991.1 cupin domain-containing protein [Hyphobacterium sp. HN65]
MVPALQDEWILDCASGAAPLAVRVLVESAAELNPVVRDQLDSAEKIGSSLVLADLWSATSAVPETSPAEDFSIPDPSTDELYPRALARWGFNVAEEPWRSQLGGVQGRKINRLCEPGIDARLLKIQPGSAIPHHDHAGEELTLVLQGGFSDEVGRYHRGDVCYGQAGQPHTPVGLEGEPCICFAVSIGGYRFRNPLMSIAAKWLT